VKRREVASTVVELGLLGLLVILGERVGRAAIREVLSRSRATTFGFGRGSVRREKKTWLAGDDGRGAFIVCRHAGGKFRK